MLQISINKLDYMVPGQIIINSANFAVQNLSINQIRQIGEDEFKKALGFFTMLDWETRETYEVEDLTTFDWFFSLYGFNKEVTKIFDDGLYFFTKETVKDVDKEKKQFIIGTTKSKDGQEIKRTMGLFDFYELQAYLIEMYIVPKQESKQEKKYSSKEAERIDKMLEERHKLMAKKNKEWMSIGNLVSVVAAGGIGLNIISVFNLTYYALYNQYMRLRAKEDFDFKQTAMIAGALNPKKTKVTHWTAPLSIDTQNKELVHDIQNEGGVNENGN